MQRTLLDIMLESDVIREERREAAALAKKSPAYQRGHRFGERYLGPGIFIVLLILGLWKAGEIILSVY